jgi:hypothetical protein
MIHCGENNLTKATEAERSGGITELRLSAVEISSTTVQRGFVVPAYRSAL